MKTSILQSDWPSGLHSFRQVTENLPRSNEVKLRMDELGG